MSRLFTGHFYLSVDETLRKLGCRRVTGEEALYYWLDDNNQLGGLIGFHVDDFTNAGTDEFHKRITEELEKIYVFGKVEQKNFRFTGVDIKETEDGIEMNQDNFCNSIEEIKINDKKNTDRDLTREEYAQFRGAVGKLNWLQESTRPDLSFDNLLMSMKSRNAKVSDVNKLNKIIRKAKAEEEENKLVFHRIDKFENLQVHAFCDASYKTQDDKVRSVEGRILFLTNGKKASPILWKSRKISRVCDSTKTAETLAADKATDDAIYLARMIHEIYTGNKSMKQIPVEVFTDSKPLYESIHSTKQVERKSIRHVVQMMKDSLARGEVRKFHWVSTKDQLADLLTKDSANGEAVKKVLKHGIIDKPGKKEEAGEDYYISESASNHIV